MLLFSVVFFFLSQKFLSSIREQALFPLPSLHKQDFHSPHVEAQLTEASAVIFPPILSSSDSDNTAVQCVVKIF